MKFCRSITLLGIISLLILGSKEAYGQEVTISLPDSIFQTGEDIEVGDPFVLPIQVGDLTGENVISYDFEILFDSQVITLDSINTKGTISQGDGRSFVINNDKQDTLIISMASAEALEGSGVLLELTGEVNATGLSTTTWSEAVFNEGDPAVNSIGGEIIMRGEPVDLNIPERTFSLESGTAIGDTVSLPVHASRLSGKNINGYNLELSFDSDIAEVVGTEVTGTLSGAFNITFDDSKTDTVSIQADATSPIVDNGELLRLLVRINQTDTSSIDWQQTSFNDGVFLGNATDGRIIISESDDGDGDDGEGDGDGDGDGDSDGGDGGEDGDIPSTFELVGNYPNPFNPSTTITFDLSEPATVNLEIYDIQGRRMMSVLQGRSYSTAGTYTESVNLAPVASGIYLYRIEIFDQSGRVTFTDVKKMTLLK